MPRINIIVARARNGVIGCNNTLPWRLPEDLAHFKRTTLGYPIVMGRNTWESIGRPLAQRRNLVVTSNHDWHAEGAERVASLTEALALCADAREIFIIGGAQLYAAALSIAERLIITEIDQDFAGDVFFAAPDTQLWQLTSRSEHGSRAPQALKYAIAIYERRLE